VGVAAVLYAAMIFVWLLLFFQQVHGTEYTCVQVYKLNDVLNNAEAGLLENSLNWTVAKNSKAQPFSSRLKLAQTETDADSPVSYLKLNVNRISYTLELNTITLTLKNLRGLRTEIAAGKHQPPDSFQSAVIALNDHYQLSFDKMSETEITNDTRAEKILSLLNINDPTILKEYLESEDGRIFIQNRAREMAKTIESQPQFAQIVSANNPFFQLLHQGFQVFAGKDFAFILSAAYHRIGICPRTPARSADAQTKALFNFLTDPDVARIINCEELMRTSTHRSY